MTGPVPDTLGGYLTADDLTSLPYGSATPIGLRAWPYDAVALFLQLRADEQRILILTAAHWNTYAGNGAHGLSRVLLALFRNETGPR
jgi:hypothetical protein